MLSIILLASLPFWIHQPDPVCPEQGSEVTVDLSNPIENFDGCGLRDVTVHVTRSGPLVYQVLDFGAAIDSKFILSKNVSNKDFENSIRNAILQGNTIGAEL